MLGVRLWVVDQWEAGSKTPSADQLHRLAEATGSSVAWLVTGADGTHVPGTEGDHRPTDDERVREKQASVEARRADLQALTARCETLVAALEEAHRVAVEAAKRLSQEEAASARAERRRETSEYLGPREETLKREQRLADREAMVDALALEAEAMRLQAVELRATATEEQVRLQECARVLSKRMVDLDARERDLLQVIHETAKREARSTLARAHQHAEAIIGHAIVDVQVVHGQTDTSDRRESTG
jgi:hypothetical protein